MSRSRARLAADWFAKLRQNAETQEVEHTDVVAAEAAAAEEKSKLAGLAAVATSGDYADLINIPPALPLLFLALQVSPPIPPLGISTITQVLLSPFYDGGTWVPLANSAPAVVGGVINLSVTEAAGPLSYDLGQAFDDFGTLDDDLIYQLTAGSSLPAGMSLVGRFLTHDYITWSPADGPSLNYTFSIEARDVELATSLPQQFSVTIAPTPATTISSVPNFLAPHTTHTASNSISKPAGISPTAACFVYLVGGGGGGNGTLYQSGWYFSGIGGSSRLIICKAQDLDGAIVTIAAGGAKTSSWQSGIATGSSIVIGGATYSTAHGGQNQIVVHNPSVTNFTVPAAISGDGFSIAASPEGAVPNISITNASSTMWGHGAVGPATSTQGGNSTLQYYGGGNGYGQYGAVGYQQSKYAGNGANTLGANAVAPGGGGVYQRSGAAGSCRIYFV